MTGNWGTKLRRLLLRRDPSQASGQRSTEREELSRIFGHMVLVRMELAPIAVAMAGWLVWSEPSLWRRYFFQAALVAIPAFFVAEWLRFRRHGVTRRAIKSNLIVATVAQLAISFATGGIESPFLITAIPIGLITSVTFKPPGQLLVPAAQVGCVAIMAWFNVHGPLDDFNLAAFGGGLRVGAETRYLWAHAAMISLLLVVTQLLGRRLRKAYENILRRELAAQRESLRDHREQAEELTALSAEIAHELKNPLASVKGLAGLLGQNLPDGKGGERLGVLRREVDRMQVILDEFLNFSRPLVPLSLGETDVTALCWEVAALHEGVARDCGLQVSVEGLPVSTRCDPRKVKQVLINLVQNAVEASSPGSEVRIVAERPGPGGVQVSVLDRGRGVDPYLGERAFAPGITTKPKGSGLGLTIARSLARQHGGELLLRSRSGGGTEAVLVLPSTASWAGLGRMV